MEDMRAASEYEMDEWVNMDEVYLPWPIWAHFYPDF